MIYQPQDITVTAFATVIHSVTGAGIMTRATTTQKAAANPPAITQTTDELFLTLRHSDSRPPAGGSDLQTS